MKKMGLFLALAVVMAVSFPAASWAGYCLENASSCNDYYLSIKPEGDGLYALHGYEYGCGYKDRSVDGIVLVSGGIAYIEFTGNNPGNFDNGQLASVGVPISLSSMTGSGNSLYVYMNGGFLDAHGYAGTSYSLSTCSFPGVAGAVLDPDESQ